MNFEEGIDAVVAWLQQEKESGRKFVHVSEDVLQKLFSRPVQSDQVAAKVMDRSQNTFLKTTFQGRDPVPVTSNPVSRKVNVETSLPVVSPLTMEKLSLQEKKERMEKLRKEVLTCSRCPNLVASRHSIVFGVGNLDSPLMFVGEAPGADEDVAGIPFVGRAGQLLTKIIAAMGLSREDVFIANILKCRPDTPGQTSGNRPPTPAEMRICLPWLLRQIEIVQPRVIVALGATAVKGLLQQEVPISRLRGHFQKFCDIDVMPTFHPSYLLRYASPQTKRLVWEDMLQVMQRLEMTISEKQRGFFLSKM